MVSRPKIPGVDNYLQTNSKINKNERKETEHFALIPPGGSMEFARNRIW